MGKGDRDRTINKKQRDKNYDKIFKKQKDKEEIIRCQICGYMSRGRRQCKNCREILY